MFTVLNLAEGQQTAVSFKCTPEKFAELIEKEGIIPAHYVARYHWVTLERFGALEEAELKGLIKKSYEMVFDKLPRKIKNQLNTK